MPSIGSMDARLGAAACVRAQRLRGAITVNTTSDSISALDNECSLREAITAANTDAASGVLPNECAAGSGTDTIDFPTVANTRFDGTLANSTITIGSQLVVSQPVTIDGGDCGTVALPSRASGSTTRAHRHRPQRRADRTTCTINGLAITRHRRTAIHCQLGRRQARWSRGHGSGRSWTARLRQRTGVAVINSGSRRSAVSPPGARNVFAAQDVPGARRSRSQGAPSGTIQGNYIGALADGTASTSPGWRHQRASRATGVTIGGTASNAGSCDGACNLIGKFAGRRDQPRHRRAEPLQRHDYPRQLHRPRARRQRRLRQRGAGHQRRQCPEHDDRRVGGGSAQLHRQQRRRGGVRRPSGSNFQAINNYIGLSVDGTTAMPNTRGLWRRSAGILSFGSGGTITDNRFGGNGLKIVSRTRPSRAT